MGYMSPSRSGSRNTSGKANICIVWLFHSEPSFHILVIWLDSGRLDSWPCDSLGQRVSEQRLLQSISVSPMQGDVQKGNYDFP